MYSHPRMIEAARKLGMEAGFALDLTTVDEEGNQLDFSQERMRAKALQLRDDDQPAIIILNPPCTMFSSLQQLNIAKMQDEDISARAKDAVTHFAFAVMLYMRQSRGNRLFALEHPVGALSWTLQLAALLLQCPGARRVNFDFCMRRMESEDENGVAPAKKMTSIYTNSPSLVNAFNQHQRNGEHRMSR